jgi:ATPase family associated with various cellular activities (AAA)
VTEARTGPYKFLDYFTEGEALFGRDEDIAEVVAAISRDRTLVLYGPSGTGKTSLLHAGVAPRLTQRGYRIIHCRLLRSPVDDVAEQASIALGVPEGGSLRDLVRRAPRGAVVVFLLDQFEELFTRFGKVPDEQRRFVHQIGEVLRDPDLDVRCIFSLREDYLAQIEVLRDVVPEILDRRYRLSALSAFGAREAIARPLRAAGVEYSPQLLERLVDVLAKYGFDPPMLQIVCTEVYEEARRRPATPLRLEEEDLDHTGGDEGIFRRYLDRVTGQVAAADQLLLRGVLDALITRERTKKAMTLEALTKSRFLATSAEIVRLLGVLEEQRLVRRDPRGDVDWFELLHDRLVPIILAWLDLDLDFFQFRSARELIANSSAVGFWRRNPETLLNEGQLSGVVGPYKERLRLDEEPTEFVLRSAILRRSADVAYWSARHGPSRSVDLTLALLADQAPAVRRGAARAAASVPDTGGALEEKCVHLALGDPEVEVRREAGRSLATMATARTIAALAASLGARPRQRAALEALADMAGAGHDLAGISWWARHRARRIVGARRLKEHDESIRARRGRGAVQGLIAGCVLHTTIGPILWSFLTCALSTNEDEDWKLVLAFLCGGSLILGAGLSALVGWVTAGALARRGALAGTQGRWVGALLRPRPALVLALPLLVGTFYVISKVNPFDSPHTWHAALPVLTTCALLLATAACTSLAESAWPHAIPLTPRAMSEPFGRRLLWAIVAGSGFPLLLMFAVPAVCLATETFAEFSRKQSDYIILALILALTVSTAVTAAVMALSEGVAQAGKSAGRSVRTTRVTLTFAAFATGLCLVLPLRRDLLFFWPPSQSLVEGVTTRPIPLPSGWPPKHLVRLIPSSSAGSVVAMYHIDRNEAKETESIQLDRWRAAMSFGSYSNPRLTFIESPHGDRAFESNGGLLRVYTYPWKPEPLPLTGAWSFGRISLAPSPDAGAHLSGVAWLGSIRVEAPPPGTQIDMVVVSVADLRNARASRDPMNLDCAPTNDVERRQVSCSFDPSDSSGSFHPKMLELNVLEDGSKERQIPIVAVWSSASPKLDPAVADAPLVLVVGVSLRDLPPTPPH